MTWPLAKGCTRVFEALSDRLRAATGDASPVEIKHILQSVPGCWERFLGSFDSRDLTGAADELRSAAEAAAWNGAMLPNHLPWLCRNDFSREDVRRVRYTIESFYAAEPVLVVLGTLALREAEPGVASPAEACPRIHPFHRALSAWPRYHMKIVDDLSGSRLIGEYDDAVVSIRDKASVLADDISPEHFVLEPGLAFAISDCLDRSCEALVLACALRRMFIRAELRARRAY